MSSTEQTAEQPAEETSRPARLTAAAAVAGIEALALLVGGLYVLVTGITGKPDDLTQAVTAGATLVALGLIPGAAARGLLRRKGWSRGPAIITQILALPVAWQLLQANSGLIPAGIALAALAVTGLVLLVNPATTEALGIGRRGEA
ncbi:MULTISPECIES: hypothetical protein [Streptomyces]|uniref:hypothetical protein n=1 Tax=Streptomyces TaxID=1883 RepID=UPI001317FADB|nr:MULTISPECIES: hypothetical protein [Streptomyces]QGZ50912.1 hypothetical protein GPZ77_23325 [Streptomyces sp. QHH-9511]GGT81551.1 hypothetical protein GCM10010272_27450 [Streptomyces lateritius]